MLTPDYYEDVIIRNTTYKLQERKEGELVPEGLSRSESAVLGRSYYIIRQTFDDRIQHIQFKLENNIITDINIIERKK